MLFIFFLRFYFHAFVKELCRGCGLMNYWNTNLWNWSLEVFGEICSFILIVEIKICGNIIFTGIILSGNVYRLRFDKPKPWNWPLEGYGEICSFYINSFNKNLWEHCFHCNTYNNKMFRSCGLTNCWKWTLEIVH